MNNEAWMRLSWQTWCLSVEASLVVALRLQKLAWGGLAAEREISKMVTEKVDSAQSMQLMMLKNADRPIAETAAKAVKHYRGKVRANSRRLTK
jgi:hypothetical protein